jgi:predicted RNase H-like HicB family nuclease
LRYAIVIERGSNSYSAYVPDLPGCVAAAETIDEVKTLVTEAIRIHIVGMIEDGLDVPLPSSQVEYVAA